MKFIYIYIHIYTYIYIYIHNNFGGMVYEVNCSEILNENMIVRVFSFFYFY